MPLDVHPKSLGTHTHSVLECPVGVGDPTNQCLFGGFVELDDGLMGNTFNILTYLALDGEIF
jgi:hypothetical protein